MLRIDAIEIDDHVLEKIEAKHGVTFEECEEAVFSTGCRVRKARNHVLKVYGRTRAGRYLVIYLSRPRFGRCYVISARDMIAHERRGYAAKD